MHPILFSVGPLTLSTYGALVAAAYLTGILWLKTQIPFMPGMDEDKFWKMIYGLFFGAIAGGKILFLLVEWRSFADGRMSLLRDFRYGFVFFGGLLGAAALGLWVRRWINAPYAANADFIGVALPLGHSIGRLGCLAAGCCYGRPTNLPWGLALGGNPASSTPFALWGVHLHPTQLYESAADLAICAFLMRRALPLTKKGELPAGTVWWSYVFLYSAARFVIEFYRGDDRGMASGLSTSQWTALACMAATSVLIARLKPRLRPVLGL